MTALRALLSGDMDTYQQLYAGLDRDAISKSSPAACNEHAMTEEVNVKTEEANANSATSP